MDCEDQYSHEATSLERLSNLSDVTQLVKLELETRFWSWWGNLGPDLSADDWGVGEGEEEMNEGNRRGVLQMGRGGGEQRRCSGGNEIKGLYIRSLIKNVWKANPTFNETTHIKHLTRWLVHGHSQEMLAVVLLLISTVSIHESSS